MFSDIADVKINFILRFTGWHKLVNLARNHEDFWKRTTMLGDQIETCGLFQWKKNLALLNACTGRSINKKSIFSISVLIEVLYLLLFYKLKPKFSAALNLLDSFTYEVLPLNKKVLQNESATVFC